MSPFGITLLHRSSRSPASAISRARKLAIVAHLQPEMRWDRPGSRLKALLVNGFLQSRMIRGEWKPGADARRHLPGLHVAAGAQAAADRHRLRRVRRRFPDSPAACSPRSRTAIELAVLAACGYALYRRLVQKPRRLERNREALLILGADHRHHGHRLRVRRLSLRAASRRAIRAIAHERSFAFVGDALASGARRRFPHAGAARGLSRLLLGCSS